ncbi:retinal guanylyl cyclase 2 isoform X1 [Alosa alosa]|uniref:retinal guanylyl cyclase 2 isoform X1 n=1 Tax=Alosa alosa TaxID=278164 RepID=UPI0020150E51|nr:retinal guanylyl cyclase 2 isoform X1 [Alosa alosa]
MEREKGEEREERGRREGGEWTSSPAMQGQLSLLHVLLPRWTPSSVDGLRGPKVPFPPHGAWLLCFLLATLSLPCVVVAPQTPAVFRVGVLGPWACDPIFAKARPRAAAHLAVQRINRDPNLSLGTTFDFVVLEEDCQTSMALNRFMGLYSHATALVGPVNPGYCDTASLIAKTWNKAMFSWACVNYELDNTARHPTFARTVPSPIRVLLALVRNFRWANMAIIASADDVWTDTANKVADALRSNGFPVRAVLSAGNHTSSMRHTLAKIRKMREIRMVILCMHSVLIGGDTQKLLLETAMDMHLTDGSLVFVPYDTLLYSLPYRGVKYPPLQKNSKLRRAYDAVLTVTMESVDNSFHQAFEEAVRSNELPVNMQPHQVSPLFGTIYSSILFLANAMQSVRDSKAWLSGASLARHSKNMAFYGFSHHMRTNHSGPGFLDYVLLDTDGLAWELSPTHQVDLEAGMVRFLGRSIHFPGGNQPKADSSCWFTRGSLCTRGVAPVLLITGFLSTVLSIVLGTAFYYCIRRRIIKFRLMRGPNKILLTLHDVTFINPSLSNKKLSFQSDMTRRPSNADQSVRTPSTISSLTPATHENSNIVIFEGDWAWLKRLPDGNFGAINIQTSDVFELMKDIRHENINPFLGYFLDCGVFAIVTDFCSRRSLYDLLRNPDVKLDWMFKSSLLLDLIKGMKYLHNRNVCHGRLKSTNCVVDGRFVLKVTDYGVNKVLEAHKFPYQEPKPEDLLWTAPEILRSPHPGSRGTREGDVYSLSIIMQEVVLRRPPFFMLNLTAEEIIQRVKKPPPLCRPVVTPDHAPLECIQLIKQCWNEQPEKRPPFEEIFDLFKNINKGRRTNIIDSMLRMLEQYSSNLEELIRERTEELEIEKQKTEKLLTQMLPPSVAEALKIGGAVEPEYFDSVSLYFSDIVGFTTISANSEPIEVVDLLNDLYTVFDAIIGNHDVYKVETIGDAYMVASGVPELNGNRHAAEIANMALDILSAVGTFRMRHMPEVPVRIRIGLHTGPCVTGVVGLTMPRYCLFGDTVTTASKMESSGMPYRIHVSQSTVNILLELKEGYQIQVRARTEPKAKGAEDTYWLVGKVGFDKPLPIPPELKSGKAAAHGLQMEEIARHKRMKAERQLAEKKK